MEEQLASIGYFQFIESQISNSDDLDLQLTDLTFSLGLIQTENQEKIKHAQKQILDNQNQIINDSQSLYSELKQFPLQSYIPQDLSNHLYHKIHETLIYQHKISNCITMFETVMQLDTIYQTFSKLIDQNDTQQIYNLTQLHNPTLQLLIQLPTINPRCEQAEKIINLLSNYLLQQLTHQFSLQNDVLQSIQISQMINTIPQSVDIYTKVRLSNIIQNQLVEQFQDNTDLHSIISDLCHFIESEIQFLQHFPSKSTFLHQYILFISQFFQQNLFKKFFPSTFSTNNLLEVFYTWFHLLRFIHNLSDKAQLLDSKALLKSFFEPYKQLIPSIVKNEISNLQKIVYKKINDKEHLQLTSNYEKLQDYELHHFQEYIEQSFKRVNQLCFSSSLEDWIFECVKLFDGFFLRMGVLLDQIDIEKNEFTNYLIDQIKGTSRKKDFKLEFKKQKQTLVLNFQLLEVLLQKLQELFHFRKIFLIEIDDLIKKSVQKQSKDDEMFKIVCELLNKSLSKYDGNSDEYFSELSLKESLEPSIEQAEEKIIQLVLKLFFNEAQNQLMNGVKIEQIDRIVQQFMSNLDIIEHSSMNNKLKPDLSYCCKLYVNIMISHGKVHPDNACIQREMFLNQIKDIQSNYQNTFQEYTIFWALLYSTGLMLLIVQSIKESQIEDKKRLVESSFKMVKQFIPQQIYDLLKSNI